MNSGSPYDVTQILQDWGEGDREAVAKLMPLVYEELRRAARDYLRRERADHTLQATALVHETYLRLVDNRNVTWRNRAHFYRIAARLMRRILLDHARAHNAAKRGGLNEKVSLDEAQALAASDATDLVVLDAALQNLAKVYPRKSEVVELKFFGGLEAKEIAEVLNVSEKTVLRDWQLRQALALPGIKHRPRLSETVESAAPKSPLEYLDAPTLCVPKDK